MKKKVLLGISMLAILATLTGCGTTEPTTLENGTTGNTTNEKTTVTTTAKKEETTHDKLVEYVDEVKDSIAKMSNSLFTVEFVADGDSLVYRYTYTTTYADAQVTAIKETIDKSINSSSSVYTNLLKEVRTTIPGLKEVRLDYVNGNGKVITSISFN